MAKKEKNEEKKKKSGGKKGGTAIAIAVLSPIIIIVMIASIFFAILEAIIQIIIEVVTAIIEGIIEFLEDPIGFAKEKWGQFSNWLNKLVGGNNFNEDEYEARRVDPSIVVGLEEFEAMKESLTAAVDRDTAGLDNIMLKKMLLAFYAGTYLNDTYIMIELSNEDFKIESTEQLEISDVDSDMKKELTPYSIMKGDADEGLGEDGKVYLWTKGTVSMKQNGKAIIYYSEDILGKIYEKEYLSQVEDNWDYAQDALNYLKKCYTYGTSGIRKYTVNEEIIEKKYLYENEGTELPGARSFNATVNLVDIEFYEDVAQYVTPMEFMINLMEISGSKDFINCFIETIGNENYVNLEIVEVKRIETVVEQEAMSRSTTVTGKKPNIEYTVRQTNGSASGLSVTEQNVSGKESVDVTVKSSGNTDRSVLLYSNGTPEYAMPFNLNKANNWTYTWKNLEKPTQTPKEKKDTSRVVYTTITTNTETKFDMEITEVKTWYAKITQSNKTNTVTSYYSTDDKGEEVEVPDMNSAIQVPQNQDKSKTYTSSANPEVFETPDNLMFIGPVTPLSFVEQYIGYTENQFLNIQYKYVISKEEEDYYYKDYEFTKMKQDDKNITNSKLRRVTITTLSPGVPKVEDNTDLFLGLLSNKDGIYRLGEKFKPKSQGGKVVKYPDLYKGKKGAGVGELLDNGAEMLFELLDTSKNTQGLTDLMRYILYRYSGTDYGVTEFDFSVFEPGKFKSVGSKSQALKEYIRYFENSGGAPTNADGTKYIIEDDGVGNLVVGYGVDIYNGGFAAQFKSAGYTIKLGEEVDVEFVDSLEDQERQDNMTAIKSATDGLGLKEYQIHALVSRAYNCGVGSLNSEPPYSGAIGRRDDNKNFVEAYKAYWNQERDDLFEKKDKNANFSHNLFTKYMDVPVTADGIYLSGLYNRRKSEWRLFQTGYYDVIDKWYAESGLILEAAEYVHKYMEDNVYFYDYGNLQISFEASKQYRTTCCASYVTWVMQEAGYLTESEGSHAASGIVAVLKSKGFTEVPVSELQPGDVMYWDCAHVQIYAGDNTVYNAGSDWSVQNANPYYSADCTGPVWHYEKNIWVPFTYGLRAPN